MIRKMLVVAAAIAMPLSVIAATGGTAGAKGVKPPPNPPVTCTISATVNFAPPGISNAGSADSSKTSTTTTSSQTYGGSGCSGSAAGVNIVSKSTKCAKKGPQPSSNSACEPGEYGYDSWANFASGGTASIQKALKSLSFTVNTIAYSSKITTSSEVVDGACGSEVGFQLGGTVSAPKVDKGQAVSLLACLGTVTGTGLSGSTFASNIGGPGTVATAQIDPSVSVLKIDGGS
jgi:hypothetical protein